MVCSSTKALSLLAISERLSSPVRVSQPVLTELEIGGKLARQGAGALSLETPGRRTDKTGRLSRIPATLSHPAWGKDSLTETRRLDAEH